MNGNDCRKWRERAGLTQQQLAARMKVSIGCISQNEQRGDEQVPSTHGIAVEAVCRTEVQRG
uniref:Putative DNA binding, helix-turn-helix domain containing protein n=1 Tax=viral metagenome TaxID=1070528 RepID=A0A6M3LGZ7_9ZZZZ